jgi:hypothetical protein
MCLPYFLVENTKIRSGVVCHVLEEHMALMHFGKAVVYHVLEECMALMHFGKEK